jgi:hypothetical protein
LVHPPPPPSLLLLLLHTLLLSPLRSKWVVGNDGLHGPSPRRTSPTHRFLFPQDPPARGESGPPPPSTAAPAPPAPGRNGLGSSSSFGVYVSAGASAVVRVATRA